MPVTIKVSQIKYKDNNGNYVGINGVAEQSTQEEIAAIEAKGAQTIASIPADYTTLSNTVDTLKIGVKNDEREYNKNEYANGTYSIEMKGFSDYIYGYFDDNGTIHEASTWSTHRVIKLYNPYIRKITIPQYPQAALVPSVALVRNNTVVKLFKFDGNVGINEIDIPDMLFDTILINWFNGSTGTPFYTNITIKCIKNDNNIWDQIRNGSLAKTWRDHSGQTIVIDMENNFLMRDGYLNGHSDGECTGTLHKNFLIPARYVRSIQFVGTDVPGVPHVYWYRKPGVSGSVLIGAVASGQFVTQYPLDGIIGINYFRQGDYGAEITIELFSEAESNNINKYFNVVKKPLTFNNKNAYFAGDSITVGHINGSQVTQNNYVNIFCDHTGLNKTNIAVSGALFTFGKNAIKTIPTQISEIVASPDYLFIAGGVNDWQMGVPFAEFRTTLNSLCDYINSAENLSDTEIIWILPINQAGYEKTHDLNSFANLQVYRNIMYEVISSRNNGNYSIINGYTFGFPDESADTECVSRMFGDKLHPSERGYLLYAFGLMNALC